MDAAKKLVDSNLEKANDVNMFLNLHNARWFGNRSMKRVAIPSRPFVIMTRMPTTPETVGGVKADLDSKAKSEDLPQLHRYKHAHKWTSFPKVVSGKRTCKRYSFHKKARNLGKIDQTFQAEKYAFCKLHCRL